MMPLSCRFLLIRCRSESLQNGRSLFNSIVEILNHKNASFLDGWRNEERSFSACNKIASSRPMVVAKAGEMTIWRSGMSDDIEFKVKGMLYSVAYCTDQG